MGYLNEKEKTREVFDEDGFLHSGDVGKKDDSGFIFITGRIKGLLLTLIKAFLSSLSCMQYFCIITLLQTDSKNKDHGLSTV